MKRQPLMGKYSLSTAQAIGAGALLTVSAAIWFWRTTHDAAVSGLMVCPGIAFTVMLLLGSDHVLEGLQGWLGRQPSRVALIPAGLWILYVTYSIGMGIADFRKGIVMAVYLGMPFLILWPLRGRPSRLWVEPVAILWIWLPLEFGIIRELLITGKGGDLHYAFAQLLALDTAIILFSAWNRTPGIGYRFESNRNIVAAGLRNFLAFAAIGIPLGLAIGFIQFKFAVSKLWVAPAQFLGIFFFTAIPEEFLFRGLIQNWLQRVSGKANLTLIVAAIIFGASHLNNGPPIPNYRYFLMASIAGVFYGLAWRRTGSLMGSSITHALVDTFWSMLFR